jgi:hypothetical protein
MLCFFLLAYGLEKIEALKKECSEKKKIPVPRVVDLSRPKGHG